MIKFKTAYAVQVFTGAKAEGRAKKIECKTLADVKVAVEKANAQGKAAESWSTGGRMGVHLPK